jgi:DNA polymerase (family 10)
MSLDRKAASGVLKKISTLMELHDENPHRVRAFSNAARAVERIDRDLEDLVNSGDILQLKGIGKGTAGVLAELAEGGTPSVLVELVDKTPEGVQELLGVAGLGPKKVRALWQDLEITSPGELEYACRENRLVELPGFGEKSQQHVLEAVRFLQSARDRWLVHQASAAADELVAKLSAAPGVDLAVVAGRLRRCCETVDRLELVVSGDVVNAEEALHGCLVDPEPKASGMWTGTTPEGLAADVRVTRPSGTAVALLWSTGSRQHIDALRRQAAAVGLRLEEGEGLWSDGELMHCPDEERLYEALGCQFVPPELREDGSEVARAARSELPQIVTLQDIRGVLHNHTTDSDGSATLQEMGRAAGERGWDFLGIADHSPAAHYANGLNADRLRDQCQRIDTINAASDGVRIVKGLEADILGDGTLDIPEGCADDLEYVVASIHTGFRMSEAAQTERISSAVHHPACRVLGHPTGRLLLARPGYAVDLERVLAECAECGVSVEINASPYRLDLDGMWARRALELGVALVINPDAHAIDGLDDVRWGVGVARKAGATPDQILNCGDIAEWLAQRR